MFLDQIYHDHFVTCHLSLVICHLSLCQIYHDRPLSQADAEADPFAYHYSSVSTPYAHYGTFVPDQLPLHPTVAHVAAPVAHGYYGYPYAGYLGHYGYPYFG